MHLPENTSSAAPDRTSAGTLRVLVCPDSFKGTYPASAVASALAEGVRRAEGRPVCLPLADGGEGSAAILLDLLGGQWFEERVSDPLGRDVLAGYAVLADGRTAVVDVAAGSGLTLVAESERDAEAASSRGTGQLIVAAVRAGAQRVLVGCGGSATTDGGAGALEAIAAAGGLDGAELVVLSDVQTTFERAAEVFAPQKGADPAAVIRLGERLQALATRWPRDPRGLARTGAAGGLSGGLWAAFNASLESGIEVVLDVAGFDRQVADADLILTGEGRLDAQSAEGKVVAGVRRRAGMVPVHVVAGQVALPPDAIRGLGLAGATVATNPDEMTAVAERITRAYRH